MPTVLAYEPNSPCTNRYLRYTWDQAALKRHQKRVKTMTAAVDDRLEDSFKPKEFNASAASAQRQRQREIMSANAKIVGKLDSIAARPRLTISAPPAVLNIKKTSHNPQAARKLLLENERIVNRISDILTDKYQRSPYSRGRLLQEAETLEKRMRHLTKYPPIPKTELQRPEWNSRFAVACQ